VLIVDDEPTIVKTLTLLLEDDYDVVGFETHQGGKKSIDWIREGNKVDYAILDILINGVTGIDIAKEIISNIGEIPMVFLTGCDMKSEAFESALNFISARKETVEIFTKPYDRVRDIDFSDWIEIELERRFSDA
jgi:CheY-like chemotaxis protein